MNSAELIQGSPEWFQFKIGYVSASRIKDVCAEGKGNTESITRRNYMAELVAQRTTGLCAQSFTSSDIQWGVDHEPEARNAFEAETGILVNQVGFIVHPQLEYAGASPDGWYINPKTGNKRGIEIKCPKTANHIKYLLLNKFNPDYQYQMDWQIACAGYEGVDFISYDPRLKQGNNILIAPYERDDARIDRITLNVMLFNSELNVLIEKLNHIRIQKGY